MLSLYSTMSSSSKPKSFLTRLVLIYCFDQSQFARPTLTQYSMAYNFFIAECNQNNVISTEQLCVCKLQNFNLKIQFKIDDFQSFDHIDFTQSPIHKYFMYVWCWTLVDLSPGLQWIVAQKNVEIICLFDLLLEDGLKRNLPLKCRCFTDIETVNSQAMSREIAIATAWKRLGKDFPEMAWATVIATVILSPVTVIGNGLVLASILLDPFKNIRRFPVSSLIFSLALADLLVGILVGPLLAYWTIYTYITNSEPVLFNYYIIHISSFNRCVVLQPCRSIRWQTNSHHHSSTVRLQSDEKENTECKRVDLVLLHNNWKHSQLCLILSVQFLISFLGPIR